MLSRIVLGHNHQQSTGIPRHIRKGVLIRRINASHLCPAVSGQQFRRIEKTSNENYYFFFHYCMLSCRYVMLKKKIGNGGGGDTPPCSDGTGTPTKFMDFAQKCNFGRNM